MNKSEEESIYQLALNHYGQLNQQLKTIEECGELIQALAKEIQTGNYSEEHLKDFEKLILGELVDVQIMIQQMIIVFDQAEFQILFDLKLNRLKNRIHDEQENIYGMAQRTDARPSGEQH